MYNILNKLLLKIYINNFKNMYNEWLLYNIQKNIYLKKRSLQRASDYLTYNIDYGRNKWN